MKTKIQIQIHPPLADRPKGIVINPELFQALNIPPRRTIILACGSSRILVPVQHANHHKHLMQIDPDTAELLGLVSGIKLNLAYKRSAHTLYLGPVLGILVDQVKPEQSTFQHHIAPFLEEVTRVGNKGGVLVYTTDLSSINLEKKRVQGWIYHNQTWGKQEFPFPDVCYNRLSSRTVENTLENQNLLKALDQRCYLFNRQFLDKWQVHQFLSQNPQTAELLPDTRLYQKPEDLQIMFKKYAVLYLKPSEGSLGRGIIRLTHRKRGYSCQMSTLSGPVRKQFRHFRDLIEFLHPRLSRRTTLIQEALPLARYGEQPVDFRILIQKASQGKWKMTSSVARIPQKHYIVSNVSQGGTLHTLAEVLPVMVHGSAAEIQRQIHHISLLVAETLERQLDGHYAELGIDLAMDKNRRLWLLEVNSKPSKSGNTLIRPDRIRPSVINLLKFVHYAGNLNRKEG